MKKMFMFLCSIVLVFSVFPISACGQDGSGVILASATNYLSNMETTQAKEGAILVASEQIDDIMYLQYNIGQMKNCFIQTVMTPTYNDGSLKKITYTEGSVTTESISKGFSNAISTTKSISHTDSQSQTLSWNIGASSSTTGSAKVGVNYGLVSGEAEVSKTFTISAEVGQSTETANSDTISKSTTENVNSSYDVTYIEEKCRSIVSEFDMMDYEKGYYYALSILADVTVYQIVAYNISTGKFYSTYFLSEINDYNTGVRMLSSSSISFNIPSEMQISPITEIGIEDIEAPVSDGSQGNPYLVSSATQLVNIEQKPNAYYRLTQDINFFGASIRTICGSKDFTGSLDGNGYKIYNFTVNDCNPNGNMGLFAVNRGIIKNLQIGDPQTNTIIEKDSNINKSAGAITGLNSGQIVNCLIVNVKVHCRKDGGNNSDVSMKAGGICGENRGVISRCSVLNSEVFSEGHATNRWVDAYAGGIAAVSYESWNSEIDSQISDCYVYNTAISARAGVKDDLFSQRNAKCFVGGLVGGTNSGTYIEYCVVGNLNLSTNSTTNFGEKTETKGNVVAVNSSTRIENCVPGLDNGKHITLISANSAFGSRATLDGKLIWIEGETGELRLSFEAKV